MRVEETGEFPEGQWTYTVGEIEMPFGGEIGIPGDCMTAVDADQLPVDLKPDYCWRCNERRGIGSLGLCTSCWLVVQAEEETAQ